jgi:hypothetical protein
MIFKPTPDRTRWEGLGAVLWLVLIDLLLLTWALRQPTDWLRFTLILLITFSVPTLAHIAYRTWGAFTLEYWVDRNSITIAWANVRHVIPLTAILRIIEDGAADQGRPQWLHWPLPHVRRTRAADLPNLMLCATQPLDQTLLLDTGNVVFAISPQHKTRFVEYVQESYRLGPAINLAVTEQRARPLTHFVGEGQTGLLLLGLGLLGVLALFGRLMVQFPALPDAVAFRYTSEGLPEVIRAKTALFVIPGIGVLTWLANGLWGIWMVARNQPTGAYMLWGGAIIVQVFSFLALNSLLP